MKRIATMNIPECPKTCWYLSKEELRTVRNGIYARHGRIFSDSGLKAYFESKSWYYGVYSAEEFDDSVLNKFERENLQIISEHENIRYWL